MKILGVDPGSKKNGWAILDTGTNTVIDKGHDSFIDIKAMLGQTVIDKIAVEGITIYSIKGSKVSSNTIVPTIITIGRFIELADTLKIECIVLDRPTVILRLTGRRPCRTFKVSKADVQKLVQEQLTLAKPIKPQHANDAIAVILAAFHANGNSNEQTQPVKEPKQRKRTIRNKVK